MADKYAINYTMKMPHKQGYHRETFKTKKAANIWLKQNEEKIYWQQFIYLFPKSKLPRPLVKDTPGDNYIKKTGTLQTYFETGMECMGLVFYDDAAPLGPPNPDFDPSKPESRNNFKHFSTYDGLTFIKQGMVLQLPSGDKVFMIRDIDFSRQDAYNISFYPRGFTKAEWMELFVHENVKVTLWVKKEKPNETLPSNS